MGFEVFATSQICFGPLVAILQNCFGVGPGTKSTSNEEDQKMLIVSSLVQIETRRSAVQTFGVWIGIVDDKLVGLLSTATENCKHDCKKYLHHL